MSAQCQYIVLANAVSSSKDTASTTSLKGNPSISAISTTFTMEVDTNRTDVNKVNAAGSVFKPYLYPNPASDNFTMVFPPSYSGVVQSRIIDFNGKALLVNNGNIALTPSSYSYHITYGKLRPGLYSVITTSKDGRKRWKK